MIGEEITADLRRAVFDHLVWVRPNFFDVNSASEIQSRITTDTTLIQTVVGSSLSVAVRNILMLVGGVILLFITNFKLSVIVLACVPLVVFPVVFFGRKVRTLSYESQNKIADVGVHVGESFRNLKILQSFNHEKLDMQRFAEIVGISVAVSIKRIKYRAALTAAVMVLAFGAIAALIYIGGVDVLSGKISPGDLAAFIFYAFLVAGALGAVSEVWGELQRALGAAERLIDLLFVPQVESKAVVASRTSVNDADPQTLKLTNVTFGYETRPGEKALRDISFAVPAKSMVAIVGPSGAGKSTVFDLIQRFYEPDCGKIFWGGRDLSELCLSSVRSLFGYVPQDPGLFSGSIRDNVIYGHPLATIEEIKLALRNAHCDQFIAELPAGLETILGEGGAGLSGGQKQRLAIARAMIKSPACLLLDEATSSLDADSEDYIGESLKKYKSHISLLVIAHRLSTVRSADHIVVLDKGECVASGTHDELLEGSEIYRRFAKVQFIE
tara:strand:- start:639 stop:2132 length:1494 start_codon:yes stop_codon:yes gene_type:complete